MDIYTIIAGALMGEAVTETLKIIILDDGNQKWKIASLILCIILAISGSMDLLGLVGVKLSIPYLGSILTGTLMARGSNAVHDIWDKLNDILIVKK